MAKSGAKYPKVVDRTVSFYRGVNEGGYAPHYNYNRHKYLNNARSPWFMRNAGRNEKSRRISSLSSSSLPVCPTSAWEFRRRQVESIIKVAYGVPFLWEICGRSTCQNGQIVWDTRERRDFALVFNNAGVMGTRSRVEQPLPLSTVIMRHGGHGICAVKPRESYIKREREKGRKKSLGPLSIVDHLRWNNRILSNCVD